MSAVTAAGRTSGRPDKTQRPRRSQRLAADVAGSPGQAAAAAATTTTHDATAGPAAAAATTRTTAPAATGATACSATTRGAATSAGATTRSSAAGATACSAAAAATATAATAAAATTSRQLRAERLCPQHLLVEHIEGGEADVGDFLLAQGEYGNSRGTLGIRRRCDGRRSAPGHRQGHAGGAPCRQSYLSAFSFRSSLRLRHFKVLPCEFLRHSAKGQANRKGYHASPAMPSENRARVLSIA
jgi:hypothetical protein